MKPGEAGNGLVPVSVCKHLYNVECYHYIIGEYSFIGFVCEFLP